MYRDTGKDFTPNSPLAISVVMPAHNSARFIREAIQSVLAQTFRDFEFLIIDDGSTDDTLKIMREFAAADSRIRVITHPNKGMGQALNDAIAQARGEWIARIDADDLMTRDRLEKQLAYIEKHPDLAVAGSWIQYIDKTGRVLARKLAPLHKPEQIAKLDKQNKLIPLTHPSVLIRKSVFEAVGGYRPQFWPAEDLDLWSRILEHNRGGILVQKDLLTRYRIHADSICAANARQTLMRVRWVRECLIRRRRGEPECTWEQFLQWRATLPLLRRLERERKLTGRTLHKIATVSYAERRYATMTLAFIGAGLLQPYLTWAGPMWWRTQSIVRKIIGRLSPKHPPAADSTPPKAEPARPAYEEPRPA